MNAPVARRSPAPHQPVDGVAARIAHERTLVAAKQLRYSVPFAQHYHEWYSSVLLGLLGSNRSARVLDCGCGTGVLLPKLSQRRERVAGLDLCLENLHVARAVGDATPLVVGDIAKLPLAPGAFDEIVCRGVLHRLDDVGAAFRQLFDILTDGGDLVIAEPIGDSRVLERLRTAALAADKHPFPYRALRYPTTAEWIAAADAAGFRTQRWFHLGYVAFPLLGFPEAISLVRHIPRRMAAAKLLLGIDRVLARVPYLKRCSWQAVFHFRKPAGRSLVNTFGA